MVTTATRSRRNSVSNKTIDTQEAPDKHKLKSRGAMGITRVNLTNLKLSSFNQKS
jgi:hypothetical protein